MCSLPPAEVSLVVQQLQLVHQHVLCAQLKGVAALLWLFGAAFWVAASGLAAVVTTAQGAGTAWQAGVHGWAYQAGCQRAHLHHAVPSAEAVCSIRGILTM